jgi:hypothetical protein
MLPVELIDIHHRRHVMFFSGRKDVTEGLHISRSECDILTRAGNLHYISCSCILLQISTDLIVNVVFIPYKHFMQQVNTY